MKEEYMVIKKTEYDKIVGMMKELQVALENANKNVMRGKYHEIKPIKVSAKPDVDHGMDNEKVEMTPIEMKYDIKRILARDRIMAYEIANYMNITESALSKRMRNLTKKQYEEIVSAINALKKIGGKSRIDKEEGDGKDT